jgi:hypothetical protein
MSDGWNLSLPNGLVHLIQIDFRLGLFLSDGSSNAQLYIETPCTLLDRGVKSVLTPAESSSLAPILTVFNRPLRTIRISNSGLLTARFGEGRLLEVESHDKYEAWQLGSSLGFLFVCSPGGKVSLFRSK